MQKNPETLKHNAFWLPADWPAPSNIKAGTTTRYSGVSSEPYNSFNLATHVGDDPQSVLHNRILLRQQLDLPNEPFWLQQEHGKHIINATNRAEGEIADGSHTDKPEIICVVLTADCVPLLICNKTGTEIAAIHLGWRGFYADIISSALTKFRSLPEDLLVWIGPHISAKNYEVRDEVKQACMTINERTKAAFDSSKIGHYFASLELLVRINLEKHGVSSVYSNGLCTYAEKEILFSYRRQKVTGRMASLIWIDT